MGLLRRYLKKRKSKPLNYLEKLKRFIRRGFEREKRRSKAKHLYKLHSRLETMPEGFKPEVWRKGNSSYKEYKVPEKYGK